MKLAHIINNLETGGAEKLISDSMAYYQNSSGIKSVDLILLQQKETPLLEKLSKKCNIINLSERSIYNLFLIFKLMKYIRKYDVIHLHLFPTLYWGVLAHMFSFSKSILVYTEHSTFNKRRNKKIFKIPEKIIYNKLDFIGCISSAVKDELCKHLRYKKDNIKVINNGIDLSKFESPIKTNYHYFNEKSFILIQVSSFRPQKDQVTLIRSLELLPENIKLLLVGEGELKNDCIRLVKRLRLEDRVKFLGLRADIPELLYYSDVSVLSSNYEGFGLAALEGMAAHKPVVASKIKGVGDVVENYGLVFEKGNREELSRLIYKLYCDQDYYKHIADKCHERAQYFNINKMVEHYVAIYNKLVKK